MMVRDDEDLAIEQLAAAGREDDQDLRRDRADGAEVPQETGARRLDRTGPEPSVNRLTDLRRELGRLRLALSALPIRPLARLEEVDAEASAVGAQRAEHSEALSALGTPRGWRRGRDPQGPDRQFLTAAIEIDDRSGTGGAERERAQLRAEVGDPDAVRSERDGVERAIADIRREYTELRDQFADHEVERRPAWAEEALGERPTANRAGETWGSRDT